MSEQEITRQLEALRQSGERVELTFKREHGVADASDPYKMRCYIGRSTGEKPVFLTIKTRRSLGGMAVSPDEIASLRPLGTYRYR